MSDLTKDPRKAYTDKVLDELEKNQSFEPFRQIFFQRLSQLDREVYLMSMIRCGWILKTEPRVTADCLVSSLISAEADFSLKDLEGKMK